MSLTTQHLPPVRPAWPRIDGSADHSAWATAPGRAIDQRWPGDEFSAAGLVGQCRGIPEMATPIHDDSFSDSVPDTRPGTLEAGEVMGLMVAYCDNDSSELRENFIGSERIDTGKKDRGYIDAGIFGTLILEAAP